MFHVKHWKGELYMANNYTADNIVVLEGLEAVRKRPAMYIGSTSSKGLHHLLTEIVDNAVDEAINGFADTIDVTINEDNSVSVYDNGRGMPVDIHPKLKIPAVQVIFTVLHAGGKFDYTNYSYSGGLHGVGASVVNALSRWLEVTVYRDGKEYRQRYESVADKKGNIVSGKPVTGVEEVGPSRKKGTKVTFLPDDRVFESINFDYELISKRLRDIAYLNSGLVINLKDKRKDNIKEENFCFKGGLSDYVKYLNTDKNVLFSEPIYISGEKNNIKVEAAFQYNDTNSDIVYSYANNINTAEGGTHETGFRSGLTKTINDFAFRFNMLKDKKDSLTGNDVREGLTAVISIKMRDIQFEGQTKEKLNNSEARSAVESVITENFTKFMEAHQNDDTARKITDKCIKTAQIRKAISTAATKLRDSAKTKGVENSVLVGKLANCSGNDHTINELYIVEGNSAGGTAKLGRDRNFQAILPLRGKPLNVEKTNFEQVIKNEEYKTIFYALGTGIGDKFDISKLNYDKIIILSDADQDGAHIRAILVTFFYRYFPELIKDGHIYIGLSPLYKISKGDKVYYAYTDEESKKATDEFGKNYTIQRYKGLGEMNPEQLWETTLDPTKRRMIRVQVGDAAEAENKIDILMGDKAEVRHDYISKYANFNKRDAYEDMN